MGRQCISGQAVHHGQEVHHKQAVHQWPGTASWAGTALWAGTASVARQAFPFVQWFGLLLLTYTHISCMHAAECCQHNHQAWLPGHQQLCGHRVQGCITSRAADYQRLTVLSHGGQVDRRGPDLCYKPGSAAHRLVRSCMCHTCAACAQIFCHFSHTCCMRCHVSHVCCTCPDM